jgi:thymidylate synthase ThyX
MGKPVAVKVTDLDAIVWDNPLRKLEYIGRVCYNSENKIADGTSERFVQSLIKHKHYSVLEHSGFELSFVEGIEERLEIRAELVDIMNALSNYPIWQVDMQRDSKGFFFNISANYRSWRDIIQCTKGKGIISAMAYFVLNKVSPILVENLPEAKANCGSFHFWPTTANVYRTNPKHATLSVRIDGLSRAAANQLVRHRLCSFAQRSQRYCDETDFDFVVPPSLHRAGLDKNFDGLMFNLNEMYLDYRKNGILKEDARYLLPMACATTIVVTATLNEWLHIIRLRVAKDAQWEIKEAVNQIWGIIEERYGKQLVANWLVATEEIS